MIAATQQQLENYLEVFSGFEKSAAGHQLPWLQKLRQDAFARFCEVGFPTTRVEDWRFTNVSAIAQTRFQLAPSGRALPTWPGDCAVSHSRRRLPAGFRGRPLRARAFVVRQVSRMAAKFMWAISPAKLSRNPRCTRTAPRTISRYSARPVFRSEHCVSWKTAASFTSARAR